MESFTARHGRATLARMDESTSIIVSGPLEAIRELEQVLAQAGLAPRIVPAEAAPEGATGAHVGLAVANEEAPRAIEVIQAHMNEGLDEAAIRATRAVVDLDAEESTCPACEATIPQGTPRCPGCGLRLF